MGNEIAKQKKAEPTSSELAAAAKEALGVAGSEDVVGIGVENLQKVTKDRFSPKQGLDAMDELTRYDENCKRADDAIRKACGDDVGLYNEYLAASAHERGEERDAMRRAVEAELKNGLNVSAKEATDRRIDALVGVDSLKAAGTLANQAADGTIASEAFQSGLNVVDSQHDFGKNQIERERDRRLSEAKTDEERKKIEGAYEAQIAALNAVTSGTRTALGGVAVKQLGEISSQTEMRSREYAPKLRDEFRNIFMQRYKAQLAMRQSPEIARAVAEDAVRSGSIRYFTERIKSGQISSVLYTLDEMEKIGDADFKASITEKAPIGTYDPSAYCFLRKGDIFALRKAAEQMVKEARAEARSNEAISIANSNAVLKSLVYGAQTQIDALYDKGDAVTPEDAQVLNKNLQDIVGKIDEMYAGNPKLVGNHVKQIKSYYRSAQARYMKTMNLASNCQNEADFKELLQKYNNATSEVSEIDVPEIDENGQLTGKTIKASVDTHKAYVITLNQARRAGFCKGAEWNTGARAHLEPQKRAHRIQAALNDFLVDKQGGQTGKSPAGRIALDVNADGTVSVGNTNSELGKTFFDDADKGWYDSDIKVHPAVIRDVVKALDSYCISSLVTPTDEQLREQLNIAFNTAQAKNDARMFGYNFLEALRQRTAARFDPVLNREIYGNDRARYRYLEQRGMPIDPSLRKSVESGKLQPSFQFLRNSIMPRSEQMKRRIAEQDNGRLDADDYIGDAEEP